MGKKQYQKPVVEKVNLNITESVLGACKTTIRTSQPGKANAICGGNKCLATQGS